MGVKHFKTAEFDAAVAAAPLAMVDFWADWCGPCKMVSPIVDQIAEENADIKVCKINIDEQSELASAFGVMSIPTLVALKDGKEITRTVGAVPKSNILKMFGK